jgi:hypothetical protein
MILLSRFLFVFIVVVIEVKGLKLLAIGNSFHSRQTQKFSTIEEIKVRNSLKP